MNWPHRWTTLGDYSGGLLWVGQRILDLAPYIPVLKKRYGGPFNRRLLFRECLLRAFRCAGFGDGCSGSRCCMGPNDFKRIYACLRVLFLPPRSDPIPPPSPHLHPTPPPHHSTKARHSEAEQSRAAQSRAEQSLAKQSKVRIN